jgi:hypothetical protein
VRFAGSSLDHALQGLLAEDLEAAPGKATGTDHCHHLQAAQGCLSNLPGRVSLYNMSAWSCDQHAAPSIKITQGVKCRAVMISGAVSNTSLTKLC